MAPAARSAVVAPGDTLWSISQERLGSSATPRQVALDVRRIHEINRNLIGDDPHLIFPGQRLALPPPVGAPAAGRASAPAADARADAGAARGAPEQAGRPAAPELAPERAPEPIALPALPEAGAVPEARSLPARAVPGGVPDDERRRLIGLGIVALTLVLAGLMAWRLPMRRDVAGDAEAWGLYPGYYYHHGEDRNDRHDHQAADLLAEGKLRPGPVTEPARRHESARSQ